MNIETLGKKEKRKRMNIILDVVKFRKNKNAMQCFDDDCQSVQEQEIVSKKVRRQGNGKIQTTEIVTGNIIVSCETHDWRELFSVSQLDNLKMPERTTTVTDSLAIVDPEKNVVER